jgi:hypothetical protein
VTDFSILEQPPLCISNHRAQSRREPSQEEAEAPTHSPGGCAAQGLAAGPISKRPHVLQHRRGAADMPHPCEALHCTGGPTRRGTSWPARCLKPLKPLAFGQYGELGPRFEKPLDQLAEGGADEAAKRYLSPSRVVAKGVQLRLLCQSVVVTAQKAQAEVCAPPPPSLATTRYRGGTPRRRGGSDAQDELHSTAQARAWADGDFDSDHGFDLDGAGRSAH